MFLGQQTVVQMSFGKMLCGKMLFGRFQASLLSVKTFFSFFWEKKSLPASKLKKTASLTKSSVEEVFGKNASVKKDTFEAEMAAEWLALLFQDWGSRVQFRRPPTQHQFYLFGASSLLEGGNGPG